MKTTLTIEQSADLIKLGVDAKFASEGESVLDEKERRIKWNRNADYELKQNEYWKKVYVGDDWDMLWPDYENPDNWENDSLCAHIFTLTDLLGLLPKWIKYHNKLLWLHIHVNEYTEKWCAEYKSNSDIDEADTFQDADELLDCLYLMLKHLLNEKLAEI